MGKTTLGNKEYHRRPPLVLENGSYLIPEEDSSLTLNSTEKDVEIALNRQERRNLKYCQRKKNGRFRIYANANNKCSQR
jgi:hypothetical protein